MTSSPEHGTLATFEHRRSRYWFSLNGPLEHGQQTVLPTGELSTLTDPAGKFTMDNPFAFDGELLLQGEPIIHRGGQGVSVEETAAAYAAMAHLRTQPVRARVEHGSITEIRPVTQGGTQAARLLADLFDSDERYRKIHEVGFGTSQACLRLREGNFFPNERWPGLHLGFGLGGHTPFHIDLTCTKIEVNLEAPDGSRLDLYRSIGLRN